MGSLPAARAVTLQHWSGLGETTYGWWPQRGKGAVAKRRSLSIGTELSSRYSWSDTPFHAKQYSRRSASEASIRERNPASVSPNVSRTAVNEAQLSATTGTGSRPASPVSDVEDYVHKNRTLNDLNEKYDITQKLSELIPPIVNQVSDASIQIGVTEYKYRREVLAAEQEAGGPTPGTSARGADSGPRGDLTGSDRLGCVGLVGGALERPLEDVGGGPAGPAWRVRRSARAAQPSVS